MDGGYAQYSFLVNLKTNEHDLVNNFGYRREEQFIEQVTREIFKSLADHNNLFSIEIVPLSFDSVEDEEENEEVD